MSEVAINLRSAPTAVCLWLRRAKTDPFGRGVEIYFGCVRYGSVPGRSLDEVLSSPPARGMVSYLCGRIAGPSRERHL